ncbi:MAG: hypothetical protein HY686_08095 [Chloroflexi bacterium]|nr:hypothetical protein [Chloroflexota bacterium]
MVEPAEVTQQGEPQHNPSGARGFQRPAQAPVPAADTLLPPECQEALRHLKDSLAQGRGWRTALLEAIALWTMPEEVRDGQHYRYLVGGEAFDWRLLARRLFQEVDGQILPSEQEEFLRGVHLPHGLAEEQFRELIGVAKYRTCLNYWYGITVEQALQAAVRAEVRKERVSKGLTGRRDLTDEAFSRIYGDRRVALHERFHRETATPGRVAATTQEKEFTYWLFKLRVKRCDGARVASDTRKALEWLDRQPSRGR